MQIKETINQKKVLTTREKISRKIRIIYQNAVAFIKDKLRIFKVNQRVSAQEMGFNMAVCYAVKTLFDELVGIVVRVLVRALPFVAGSATVIVCAAFLLVLHVMSIM